MINWTEKKLAEFFAKAFHEIVVPLIEDLREEMATKQDIDRLERKIDAAYERSDRYGKKT